MKLRFAQYTDLIEMKKLYVDTIRHICSKDYSDVQIAVWTSYAEDTLRWENVLANQHVIIAEKD